MVNPLAFDFLQVEHPAFRPVGSLAGDGNLSLAIAVEVRGARGLGGAVIVRADNQ